MDMGVQGATPHQEDICNSYLLAKGKSVFSMKYHCFFNHKPISIFRSSWPLQNELSDFFFFDCLFREGFVSFNFILCFIGFALL